MHKYKMIDPSVFSNVYVLPFFTKNPYLAKHIKYVQGQHEHHTKKNSGSEIMFFV